MKGAMKPWKWAALLGIAGMVLCALLLLRQRAVPVPVLMYHHFIEAETVQADTVVTARRFDEQMKALKDAGYTAITPEELIAYVDGEGEMPEKPVLITMDDGYTSNLTIAAPILEQYGMKATVFAVGINVGQVNYVHSGQPLDPPRFGWEEARPWWEKGVIQVQSHTYDLHQRADYGFSGRDGVLPLEGEREEDYRTVLEEDIKKAKKGLSQGLGAEMNALAFPFGLYTDVAVDELEKAGVRLTLTTEYGCSRAEVGQAESIQCMKRWGISDRITGEALVEGLETLDSQSRGGLFENFKK